MVVEMTVTVAYVDLLGFTDRVLQGETRQVLGKYAQAIRDATTILEVPDARLPSGKPLRLYTWYSVFSDSLLIYDWIMGPRELRKDWNSLCHVIKASAHLSYNLIEFGQPFKGCITQGKCWHHEDPNGRGIILAGKPVLDAVDWERKLNWIGILIDPTLANKHSELKSVCDPDKAPTDLSLFATWRWPLMVAKCKNIPLHFKRAEDTKEMEGIAVVPARNTDNNAQDSIEALDRARTALDGMCKVAPELDRAKYQVTLRCYEQAIEQRRAAQWPDDWRGGSDNPRPGAGGRGEP